MATADELCRIALKSAIYEGKIRTVFQPIVTVQGVCIGFEALTRFPNGCPPDRVWALAESFEDLSRLDAVALTAAVKLGRSLPGKLFLNVSAIHLSQTKIWERCGTPERIAWEITETQPLNSEGLAAVAWLNGRGYSIAMDDAGEGFATPRYFSELRPHIVKLSISVVYQWLRGRPKALRDWITFARSIRSTVIAEGVEDLAWIPELAREGVDAVQGYAIGRPAPASEWKNFSLY